MILALLLQAGAQQSDFTETQFRLPTDGTRLALRDMDGDGGADLIWISRKGLAIRFLRPNGSYLEAFDTTLPWPEKHMAWDFADLDGDGATEFVAVVDSNKVSAWSVNRDSGFGERRDLLVDVGGSLPRGNRSIGFARDINGDGRVDVVVPASGRYHIFINDPAREGGWSESLDVIFEPSIDYDMGSRARLDSEFGVSVQIPWFSLRDLDGDGLVDLVSEAEDTVQFHIASPELPSEPSWRLNKAALRPKGGGPGELDFDDLFAFLGEQVGWRIADLDGEGALDLIVQQGSTFKIYLGGSRTGNERQPDSLMKSGGRVLTLLLNDLDGDERVELMMVRAEKISLGRVVRWLVLPGSLDFEIFAYRNEGGSFARKPMQRVALRLKIPRLLSFIEEMDEVGSDISDGLDFPTTVGSFDSIGESNDIVDIVDGKLAVFLNCAPESTGLDLRNIDDLDPSKLIETFLLEQIEGLEDGGVAVLDLGDLADIDFSPAEELRTATAELEPDMSFQLSGKEPKLALEVVDINGDGLSDLILFQDEVRNETRLVQVLVTNKH